MLDKSNENKINILKIENHLLFAQIKESLDLGKKVIFNVVGCSMLPFLKQGDRLVLKPIEEQDLKKWNIILVSTKQGFILHRIVKLSKDKLWLAGDGNLRQIEMVMKDEVWGKAIAVIDDEEKVIKDLESLMSKQLAKIWFWIRPLRLVIFKLGKLFQIN